jgi:hypothetical protein
MNIDIQNYKNGLCCPTIPTPEGLITLTGGIADGLYTDLATAISYIQNNTIAPITNATLVGDVFKFTVPANSDFSLSAGFMMSTTGSFVDNQGLVTAFGNFAFTNSSGNNILGDCTFGDDSFSSATGTNTISSILLNNSISGFADNYTGTMNILGNIGTTEGSDYPNIFGNTAGATINALVSKQTSDGGNIEGDLISAISQGATVNFVL